MEKLVACIAQMWFWPILPHKQPSNLEGSVGLFYELWSLVLIFYWIQVRWLVGLFKQLYFLSLKPIESFLGCVWDHCLAEMSTLVSSSSSWYSRCGTGPANISTDKGQDCFLITAIFHLLSWLSMPLCTYLSSCVQSFSCVSLFFITHNLI